MFIVLLHLGFLCILQTWVMFYCSWYWTSGYVKELPIHIDCTWLADSMNTWVDRVVVWEGLIPLSGFFCKSVDSVGKEILHLSGKSSGNFRTSGCDNFLTVQNSKTFGGKQFYFVKCHVISNKTMRTCCWRSIQLHINAC